jgi:hypothetical protein
MRGEALDAVDELWDEIVPPFQHDVDIAGCLFDAAPEAGDAVENGQ